MLPTRGVNILANTRPNGAVEETSSALSTMPADDVGRNDVDHRSAERPAQDGDRHVLLGIFHRVTVRARRLQPEERPEGDRHRRAGRFVPGLVVGVPPGRVDAAVEPEPTDGRDQHYRGNHAPYGDGADLAGNACATEIGEGCQPQQRDGGQANLDRVELYSKERLDITDGSDADRHVGNQQRKAIGVVGDVVAGLAEGVFGVAAHAAGFATEHAAAGERIGQCQRARGGDEPGQDRDTADFGEFGGQQDNARSQHVDGGQHGQLPHAHFLGG